MMIYLNNENELGMQLRQLYLEILTREPDPGGFDHYLNQLKKRKQSIDDIKEEMLNSDEYKILHQNNMNLRRMDLLKKKQSLKSTLPKEEIQKLVDSVDWYHAFDFDGISPKDIRTSLEYQLWAAQGIPDDLTGKTVLDIGTADGFYSFLAESRGAKRVVAVDFMKWDGFDIAKKILNSNVEHKILRVESLDQLPDVFDIVFFFGVYYHLANPVDAIQKIFTKTNERAFLAGHIIDAKEPLMCYYDKYEMHPNDASNWWAASPSCLVQIAKRVGFSDARLIDRIYQKEMLNVQTDEAKNSIRRLGHIGVFEFIK